MKKNQFKVVAAALAACLAGGTLVDLAQPTVAFAQEVEQTPSVIAGVGSEHPYSYVLITLDPTDAGTFDGEKQFWVDPTKEVTIPVEANPAGTDPTKPFVQWDKPLTQKFAVDTTIYAMYWEDVVAGHNTKHPDNYVEVVLDPTDKFTPNGETNFWVNPTKEVTIPAQDPTPKDPNTHSFDKWDKPLTQKFEEGTTITAVAKEWDPVIPVDPGTDPENTERPDGFILVTLNPTDKGTLEGSSQFWVNPDVEVTIPAGKVTPKKETEPFTRWDKQLTGTFKEATTINAQYGNTAAVGPQTGIAPIGFAGAGVAAAIAAGAAALSRKKKED